MIICKVNLLFTQPPWETACNKISMEFSLQKRCSFITTVIFQTYTKNKITRLLLVLRRIFGSSPVQQILIFMKDFLGLWWSRRSLKALKSGMNIVFHAREQSGLLYSGMLNSVWLLEKRITIQSQSIRIWPRVKNLFMAKP